MARIKNPMKIKQSKCGIIYGENGHGKTHWALTAGGNILLLDLNGERGFIGNPNLTDNVAVEVIDSLTEFDKFIKTLDKELKSFDTLIVDNITQLQDMFTSNTKMQSHKAYAAYNAHIVDNIAEIKKACIKNDVDVIFIAHQTLDEEREGYIGEEYCSTVFPAVRATVLTSVMGMMDFIFHVFITVEESTDADGNDILESNYKVHLGLHEFFKTKCRGKKPPKSIIDQDKRSLEKLFKYLKK